MKGDQIPLVIVGTGHGCRVHLPAAIAAGFHVAAVVGSNPERTRRRADKTGVAGAYTNLTQAIEETGARAIAIASPPHTHGQAVLTAAALGCHVLCEKPFARDAEQAREMLSAVERAGLVNLVGNQMRAMPERIVASRALADGAIGTPRLLTMIQHASLMHAGLKWPDWWLDKQAGGGWLGASGSHMIDQVHSWLGPFASLSASLPLVSTRESEERGDGLITTPAEDSFALRFELKNGVEGIMQQTGATFGPTASMTRVVGTAGTLWLEEGNAWIADARGTRALPIPDDLRLTEMAPSDDPRKQFLHVELPPAIRLFTAFRQGIEGTPPEPGAFATFADGVAAMEVIDAVRLSAQRQGQRVEVGP